MANVNPLGASRRRCWRTAFTLASAVALANCSSGGMTGGGPSTAAVPASPPSAPSADSSFTGRVKSYVTGSSGSSLPPAPPAGPGGIAAPAVDCPTVEYRQGAATLAVSGSGENATLGLRYQGSFVQTARECQLRGGQLTIKVGVQGRVVVGPAGAPRDITIPLRYALVREGQGQKTLWTKLFMVPVTLPDGELNVPFIHVEEEMTVPNPPPAELDGYVIYIGFDPEGVKEPKPKPAAKPAAKPKTAGVR